MPCHCCRRRPGFVEPPLQPLLSLYVGVVGGRIQRSHHERMPQGPRACVHHEAPPTFAPTTHLRGRGATGRGWWSCRRVPAPPVQVQPREHGRADRQRPASYGLVFWQQRGSGHRQHEVHMALGTCTYGTCGWHMHMHMHMHMCINRARRRLHCVLVARQRQWHGW